MYRKTQVTGAWSSSSPAPTENRAEAKAEAFLKTYYGDHYAHLDLYEIPGDTVAPLEDEKSVSAYTFRFARKENGYFFPEQNYTVRIDAADGSDAGYKIGYITSDPSDGFWKEVLESFTAACEEQGVEMVKILEAIYQSAQTGREVLL